MGEHQLIKEWVMEGENSTLEFKMRITDIQKIARTICAFANTKGGRLVVGVMDDGDIVGVIEVEKERKRLLEAAQFYCLPAIELAFEIRVDNYLEVLVARVKESRQKPHKTIERSGEEFVYVRSGASIRRASKLVIKTLQNEPIDKPSFERPLTGREQALVTFLQKRENITIKRFAQLINFSERRARRMLVDLTREGLLHVHTTNKEDIYTLV